MNLHDEFHFLRMTIGEKQKTAFHYCYKFFKYQVIPFGLYNGSRTFQHFTNDTFQNYLNNFLIIYLNDLLIYSKILKKYKIHVCKILKRFHKIELYVKLQKYQFHVQEITFLEYKVSYNEIRMNSVKIKAIISWFTSQSVHDIQVFLSLINFYK